MTSRLPSSERTGPRSGFPARAGSIGERARPSRPDGADGPVPPYQVVVLDRVAKAIDALHPEARQRIQSKFAALAGNPRPRESSG